jgi:hypothetical protein
VEGYCMNTEFEIIQKEVMVAYFEVGADYPGI